MNEVQLEVQDQRIRHQVLKTERSQFARKDESALIQVSPNFLAANHLRPYLEWEHLRDITLRALEAYLSLDTPKSIRRAVIQYINHIEFDTPKVDLEDYFEYYPKVSDPLAKTYGAFFVGIHIPFDDKRAVLAVEMTPGQPGPDKERLPIVLNLTYQSLVPLATDKAAVLEWLEAGHTRINDAFEACLKDNLRQKFGVK